MAASTVRVAAKVKKRNDLTLQQKVSVIKAHQKDPQPGIRQLAEQFECGKTQISTILQNKAEILDLYESNSSGEVCQTRKRIRNSKFGEMNDLLYQWYCKAISRNIYPDGPLLKEKAKQIASQLGYTEESFTASNGWLESWKKRHNVKQVVVSGESGDVRGETVSSWKERLPEIVVGYEAKDVWNLDETGCFWRALPEKGFGEKGKECKGGKKAKQRVTIAFIVNATGESEGKPIVIWKSENPRCFKNVDKKRLPVQYFSQSKAWMSGEIMDTILKKINVQLKRNGRSVLLLMDNAGCHPPELKDKYSNVKIVFLPANTTSKLQPLDLGVIKNFKVHYKKLLLHYVVAKIDECSKASEVTKKITVLQAIRWIGEAWKKVSSDTIKKCFRLSGVLDSNFQMRSVGVLQSEADPFEGCDNDGSDDTELNDLILRVQTENSCSVQELIAGEDDIPVCTELDDDNWDEVFFSELGPASKKSLTDEDDDSIEMCSEEVENTEVECVHTTTVHSYSDAIKSLENVCLFLEDKGHTDEATTVSSFVSTVVNLSYKAASSRQSSITDFFQKT